MRLALLCFALAACAPETEVLSGDPFAGGDKGDGQNALLVDRGPVQFGVSQSLEVSVERPLHYWTFELTAPATVSVHGETHDNGFVPLVYLYEDDDQGKWQQQAAGVVDASGQLGPGVYRVLVHPAQEKAGQYSVTTSCSGEGCPAACALGTRWSWLEQAELPAVRLSGQHVYDPAATADVFFTRDMDALGGAEAVTARADGGVIHLAELSDGHAHHYNVILYQHDGQTEGAVVGFARQVMARIGADRISDCRIAP